MNKLEQVTIPKRGRGRPKKVVSAPVPIFVEHEENEVLTRVEVEQGRERVHKDRIPIHQHRDILATYNIPEGYTGRWIKDLPGRIEAFINAGWSMLNQRGILIGEGGLGSHREVGDVITRHAGPNDGYTLYLMVLPTELYLQDQAVKQRHADEVDRAMEAETRLEGRYGTLDRSSSTNLT